MLMTTFPGYFQLETVVTAIMLYLTSDAFSFTCLLLIITDQLSLLFLIEC